MCTWGRQLRRNGWCTRVPARQYLATCRGCPHSPPPLPPPPRSFQSPRHILQPRRVYSSWGSGQSRGSLRLWGCLPAGREPRTPKSCVAPRPSWPQPGASSGPHGQQRNESRPRQVAPRGDVSNYSSLIYCELNRGFFPGHVIRAESSSLVGPPVGRGEGVRALA